MSSYRSGSSRRRPPGRGVARVGGGTPPRQGRTYGGRGNPRRPGSGAHLAVLVCLVLSVLATLGGIGVWSYAKSLNDDLLRSNAFDGVTDRPENEGGLNIMVLGSDSRNPDSTAGSRADTIMLMHVPSDRDKTYLVSLPRDLWVPIPAGDQWGGGEAKLNAAVSYGGTPLMVQTVEDYTGVRIDHVVEIDFDGLKNVVNALGGVSMNVQPADDDSGQLTSIHTYKGQDGPRTWAAGPQDLDGESALDYVRQRKQFNEGDFARMRHQQQLLMAMLDKATSAGIITSPGAVRSFIGSVIDTVQVDNDFDLLTTAEQLSGLRSQDLVFITSPNLGSDVIGDQSVVVSDDVLAGSMYHAMSDDHMTSWVSKHPDVVKGGASDTGGGG